MTRGVGRRCSQRNLASRVPGLPHADPAGMDCKVALPGPGAMETTFEQFRKAYGDPMTRFVALQLEPPTAPSAPRE